MTFNVRIVQLGKGVFQYAAEPGATVAAGLQAAGITPGALDIRVNGRPASPDQELADRDLVTIVPMIKGGARLLRHRQLEHRRGCAPQNPLPLF